MSGSAISSQVPAFEVLPAFEEESGAVARPGPVSGAFLDPGSRPGRQLHLLATRLLALGRDKRLRRIGVVGAVPHEGSTTVALGLAGALSAHPSRRVLLLEGDLEHPSVDGRLRLDPPASGLARHLAGEGETPVLRRPAPRRFWVLSAGRVHPGSPELLASPRLRRLLRATDRVFDHLVVDCPPVLEGEAFDLLDDHLDGVVLVVRSRHAPREIVRRAALHLRPGQLVGVVLNAQRDILPR